MNIVSLLPSGTEMVAELGLTDRLVGRSFECDFPPSVESVDVVVRPRVDPSIENHGQIDREIDRELEQRGSIYRVDEERLRELQPDLIISQDLCEVCAPSNREISAVLKEIEIRPEVLSTSPATIDEVIEDMRKLADLTNSVSRFKQWRSLARERMKRVEDVKNNNRNGPRRVACVEWYNPIYSAGHWVPQQVRIAGGIPTLASEGEPSKPVSIDRLIEVDPDLLVLMPCGMDAREASGQASQLFDHPGCDSLSAVRNDRVFAVDASSYFARPGPRVIEGTELLAHLLHPGEFQWNGSDDAYCHVPKPEMEVDAIEEKDG